MLRRTAAGLAARLITGPFAFFLAGTVEFVAYLLARTTQRRVRGSASPSSTIARR